MAKRVGRVGSVFLGCSGRTWEEVKVALGEHTTSKLVDQGPSLYEEVSEHGV